MRAQTKSLLVAVNLATFLPAGVWAQDLLWSEEFNVNGAPDPNTWSYDYGNNNGWGNNELQTYTSDPANVVVENGLLKIIARKDDADPSNPTFTSARIKTDDKFSFTYGTLEARIKVPDMDAGLWPAFWTMGSDFYQVGWPKSGEIDIMEMGQGLAINEGLVNRRVVSAAHWDIFGQYATYARSYDSPIDLTQDYHIYKLEWTPTTMTTYVDGNWIWEIDICDECPSCSELHQPHHVLFNMAVGGGFTSGGTSSSAAGSSSSSCGGSSSAGASSSGGCPSRGPDDITAPLPAELLVDWVRLYDNGFTQVDPSPTNSPTPSPTAKYRQPETPPPTRIPTMRPTPIPTTQRPTPAPSTAIPVTLTQSPVQRQPEPVGGGSGKAGKGGKAGGGTNSRSATSGGGKAGKAGVRSASGSRQFTSGGKAGKGSKGVTSVGSRQFTSGGKAGKGGKGKWSRSGTTATGGTTRASTLGSATSPLETATADSPDVTPAPVGPAAPSPTERLPNPSPPNTLPTTASTVGGTDFEPIDEDAQEYFRPGPQSLVVERFSAASTARMNYYLSILLPGLLAIGLMTGAATRW